MGIFFGVVAAVSWGFGDFLITLLTRRIGTRAALLFIQALSLLAWILIFLSASSVPQVTPGLWGILIATAICHVLGLGFVYRAFEVGTLSIVSPISASFAIVTAVLSLATGEHPPALILTGAGLLVMGIALATRSESSQAGPAPTLRGIPEAILSALAFGVMFWLFYFYVHPKLGYGLPLIALKLLATGGSLAWFLRGRDPAQTKEALGKNGVLLAVGAAAADTVAWLAYIGGTRTTYATVVTALASLFSVVTVLLAWTFFRERLARHQWAGVAIILAGILLVSV